MDEKALPAYPTVVIGYVRGPLRLEADGGHERYIFSSRGGRWLFNWGPRQMSFIPYTRAGVLDMGVFAVTHLQKMSHGFGFLLTRPFCLHLWFTIRRQKQDAKGGWIPGTERVLYARTPGWRWDAGDGMFVKTGGYAGLHWD